MKILVQWAVDRPGDWETIDSSEWSQLPKRPARSLYDTSDLGGGKGLIAAVCVQGIVIDGDDIAVEDTSFGCRVYSSTKERDKPLGIVWEFEPLQPDPDLGGMYNTHQRQNLYFDPDELRDFNATAGETQRTIVRPIDALPKIDTSLTRHGNVLVPNAEKNRKAPKWTEWTEGLPREEIIDGKLRNQQALGRWIPPQYTVTIYIGTWATAYVAAYVPLGASYHGRLRDVTAAGFDKTCTPPLGNGYCQAFTWEYGVFGYANWGTGIYRAQIETFGLANITAYGFRAFGASNLAGFNRLNDALTVVLEHHEQIEANFSGTGYKLATTGPITWNAGAVNDQPSILLATFGTAAPPGSVLYFELSSNLATHFVDGPFDGPAGPLTAPYYFRKMGQG